MRRSIPAILVAVLALLSLVPAAQASTRSKIIADCSDDGVLQGTYTPAQLRDARKHLPSDVSEYSDCADLLRRAELPDTSSNGTGGGGTATTSPGGSTTTAAPTPTPPAVVQDDADRQALVQSRSAPDAPVKVAGQNLLAGASPLRDGYRGNGLPTSLIVALILLAIAGLALSIPPVRRKLPFFKR